MFSRVDLGDYVDEDQLLGTVTDPITNVQSEIRSSYKGRVLGMALNQFVMPGFAAYRIGIDGDVGGDSEAILDGVSSDSDDIVDPGNDPESADVADIFDGDDGAFDLRDNLEDSE